MNSGDYTEVSDQAETLDIWQDVENGDLLPPNYDRIYESPNYELDECVYLVGRQKIMENNPNDPNNDILNREGGFWEGTSLGLFTNTAGLKIPKSLLSDLVPGTKIKGLSFRMDGFAICKDISFNNYIIHMHDQASPVSDVINYLNINPQHIVYSGPPNGPPPTSFKAENFTYDYDNSIPSSSGAPQDPKFPGINGEDPPSSYVNQSLSGKPYAPPKPPFFYNSGNGPWFLFTQPYTYTGEDLYLRYTHDGYVPSGPPGLSPPGFGSRRCDVFFLPEFNDLNFQFGTGYNAPNANLGMGFTYIPVIFFLLEGCNTVPCFAPNTMISTDQGPFTIQSLRPTHSIGGSRLIAAPSAINKKSRMIRFEKGALGTDLPKTNVWMTGSHMVRDPSDGQLYAAREFVNRYPGVKVDYSLGRNNKVYHIILENTDIMINVDGLECESLAHTHVVAKKYITNKPITNNG